MENELKSPKEILSNGGDLQEVLRVGLNRLKDFGENNELLRKYFFELSEVAPVGRLRDTAIELMLYCGDDEQNDYGVMPSKEIVEQIQRRLEEQK